MVFGGGIICLWPAPRTGCLARHRAVRLAGRAASSGGPSVEVPARHGGRRRRGARGLPSRCARAHRGARGSPAGEIEELEAAKAAKYREIRELELDLRMGKLDEAEFRLQDRERRAEAVELLRRLDALGAGELPVPDPAGAPGPPSGADRLEEPAATIRR
jgi:hypothetical protein